MDGEAGDWNELLNRKLNLAKDAGAQDDVWADIFHWLPAMQEAHLGGKIAWNPLCRGPRNFAFLHHAAWAGNVTACRELVERFGADVFEKSRNGEFPSQVAQNRKNSEAQAYLEGCMHTGSHLKGHLKPEVGRISGKLGPSGDHGGDWEVHVEILCPPADLNNLLPGIGQRMVDLGATDNSEPYHLTVQSGEISTVIIRGGATPVRALHIFCTSDRIFYEKLIRKAFDDVFNGKPLDATQLPASPQAIADMHRMLDVAKGAGCTKHPWLEVYKILDVRPELVNIRGPRTYAVLHHAAYHGNERAAKTLCRKYNANPALRCGGPKPLKPREICAEKSNYDLANCDEFMSEW